MNEPALTGLEYLLGTLELAVVLTGLAITATLVRRAFLPDWSGPPAVLASVVAGITASIVLAEALGTFGAFTPAGYTIGCVVLAGATWLAVARYADCPLRGLSLTALRGTRGTRTAGDSPQGDSPRSLRSLQLPAPPGHPLGLPLVAVVCAAVFAGWAIPTLAGIANGMGRADTLWYHMPLAVRFADTGNTGVLDFFDPIFYATFYPANSEILHAIPILSFGRDFVSPVLNLGFLSLGLLAGWAIGRPYGLGAQSLLGVAVVLGAETMTNFQAGEALNDITGVAFLLAAVALLVNGYAARGGGHAIGAGALGFAAAAAGLAAGTKLSFLAPVAFLTVGVVVLAPRGKRLVTTAVWSVPMLLAGGYWFARNLVTVGNPIPFSSFGPLGLPMPERDFELRPGFAVVHYWNDTGVWFDWFIPKLSEELGPLWPLVLGGLVFGGVWAVVKSREPILRLLGAVALLTALAYLFTPLTAGGEEGQPIAFEWNIRYLAPAVAIGLAVLPLLPPLRSSSSRRSAMLAGLGVLALVTTLSIVQWPVGGHTKGAVATGFLVLSVLGTAFWARTRGWVGPAAPRRQTIQALAALGLAAILAGFLVQRHYLERRYEDLSPRLNIAESVRWANTVDDARIAVSGVRGVFNQYAYSGWDLSNHVQWLGIEGEDKAYLRIADCETWREELNRGEYDYVVTLYDPFLPDGLTDTKEGQWTREDIHTEEILDDGPVSVFRIDAPLDPAACGDLPDLEPSELNGDSVNLDPLANQPPPR